MKDFLQGYCMAFSLTSCSVPVILSTPSCVGGSVFVDSQASLERSSVSNCLHRPAFAAPDHFQATAALWWRHTGVHAGRSSGPANTCRSEKSCCPEPKGYFLMVDGYSWRSLWENINNLAAIFSVSIYPYFSSSERRSKRVLNCYILYHWLISMQ